MRSRSTLLAALSILTVIAAACAPQAAPGQSVPAYGQPSAAIPATGATNTVAAPTSMPPATQPPASATQPPSGSSSGGAAQVALATDAKLGSILVDGSGMTLYLFTKDSPNTPTCYNGCAKAWPALLASGGSPTAGAGVDASKLGTVARTDGTTQVTYNGWPLYYYAKDHQPGDVTGQGVGSVWYVLSPSGDAVQ